MEHLQHKHMHRRKTQSFSSSLLDAIYRSIDDPKQSSCRRGPARVEHEVESLRRAIKIEKNHTTATPRPHSWSNSGSSTDSSFFSSSEAESSSARKSKRGSAKVMSRADQTVPKRDGRFTRALKIYGDLKKAKEPGSPSGRFASFLNSIFSPRRNNRAPDGWGPVRKSRSMKDASSASSSAAAGSYLNRNPISKSTTAVRFCHVSVLLTEDGRSCGPRAVGRGFVMKDSDGQDDESDVDGDDDRSCASSDLFELENIGYGEELPVYGTTSVKMNRVIAGGLIE